MCDESESSNRKIDHRHAGETFGSRQHCGGKLHPNENGTFTFEYEGYTEVFWEEQRTARSNGRPIFLDEEGFQWEETQLLLSEE